MQPLRSVEQPSTQSLVLKKLLVAFLFLVAMPFAPSAKAFTSKVGSFDGVYRLPISRILRLAKTKAFDGVRRSTFCDGRPTHRRRSMGAFEFAFFRIKAPMEATRNKCIASRNKCLTSSNKKLLGTRSY